MGAIATAALVVVWAGVVHLYEFTKLFGQTLRISGFRVLCTESFDLAARMVSVGQPVSPAAVVPLAAPPMRRRGCKLLGHYFQTGGARQGSYYVLVL